MLAVTSDHLVVYGSIISLIVTALVIAARFVVATILRFRAQRFAEELLRGSPTDTGECVSYELTKDGVRFTREPRTPPGI